MEAGIELGFAPGYHTPGTEEYSRGNAPSLSTLFFAGAFA